MVDYAYLVIKKAVDEMIIGSNAGVSTVKIVVVEALVLEAIEINGDSNYMAMTLMNQNTIVLFQIIVLGSKTRYFETIIFSLVPCLVDIVTKA